MASGHSDYVRGEMEVVAHKETFGGFMNWTIYGGAAVALVVIYPTLIFGVGLSWPISLVVTIILGILMGMGLKLKGGWYASLMGTAIFVAIASAVVKMLAGLA